MFGMTKREKNEKSRNGATAELKHLDAKARGKKLSRLRKRYPNRLIASGFDFADELFDYDLIILYLLLCDDTAMEEADLYDNPEPIETEEMVEAAVVTETTEVEEQGDSPDQSSFDSSTPVESSPAAESTPETTSFDSDSNSGGYSGGGGGYDSGGSFDSGGGDDGGGGGDD